LPFNLSISKVGPEAEKVLRNLFEHYLHDMSEWFEINTKADGSYSYDTASIWKDGYDAYLAKIGDSITGFALVGSAAEWLGDIGGYDVHEFFVLRRFRRNGIGQRMQHYCGTSFQANGWSGCWKQMRRPCPSGEARFQATRVVCTKRKSVSSTDVHGDSSGSYLGATPRNGR
jgi:predicted acetyltransferase